MLSTTETDCSCDDAAVTTEDVDVVATVTKLGKAPPTLATPAWVVAMGATDDELPEELKYTG